jgi:hypothetical protein
MTEPIYQVPVPQLVVPPTYAPTLMAMPPVLVAPEIDPTQPQALGLNKRFRSYLDLRRERPRSGGYHPSDTERFCPVLEHFSGQADDDLVSGDPARVAPAFKFKQDILESRRFHAGLKMEFIVGDAIHDIVKYGLGILGMLWGVWECPHCRSQMPEGFMPRITVLDVEGRPMPDAAPCMSCHARNYRYDMPWSYVEPAIGDTTLARELGLEFGVRGNMDGDLRFYWNGRWYRYVLEVKSINSAGFTGKRGPLPKPEHISQASLYAYCKGISHVMFVYVCKDAVSEWKEIVAPMNMDAIVAAHGKIRAVLEGRRTGQPPLGARICNDIREERAQKCPAVEKCFGRKPAPNFWKV